MDSTQTGVPASSIAGLRQNFKGDARAGFLVFLIALPLCLAVSQASSFPPVAGIITAVIGGLMVTFVGGSELTIKGPAVGLVVIAASAVQELGRGDALLGYRLTLGVIVVAGIIQIIFGLMRSSILSDFFPAAAVHGMMAAIGITIIVEQLFVLTGTQASAQNTVALIGELPGAFAHPNPDISIIGAVSLALLFGLPLLGPAAARRLPVPLLVILVAIPLGRYFDLGHAHSYLFLDHHQYTLGPGFLVKLPVRLSAAFTSPDFSQILSGTSVKYIVIFALVGSLETLLTTRAVDVLDPYKRKSNLNRDLLGVGVGNALAGLLGGLPMIAGIVRSSANVNSGAKTRWANFFHGLFLLLFVTFAARLLSQIPLSALAALLIYIGCRLASPGAFVRMFRAGGEQLVIFLVTTVAALASDLLLGLGAGILTQFGFHLFRGLPLRSAFKAHLLLETHEDGSYHHVSVHDAAVFSNYLSLKQQLESLPQGQHIVIDLTQTKLVDHTALENLERFRADYLAAGGYLELAGLKHHKPAADYPTAARIRQKAASLASA